MGTLKDGFSLIMSLMCMSHAHARILGKSCAPLSIKISILDIDVNGCDTDETVRMRRLACVIDYSFSV